MSGGHTTCWDLVQTAANGHAGSREELTTQYLPVVRDALAARWAAGPLRGEVDDAVQEVFVECFRKGGALQRARPDAGSGFRGFLFGVTRNVALRFERQHMRRLDAAATQELEASKIPGDDVGLSVAFDSAWAGAMVRRARQLQTERANEKGEAARRRVAILELRFQEDLPIREIAQLLEQDPAYVHHQYAQARKEFRTALEDVVREHQQLGPGQAVAAECERLLDLL